MPQGPRARASRCLGWAVGRSSASPRLRQPGAPATAVRWPALVPAGVPARGRGALFIKNAGGRPYVYTRECPSPLATSVLGMATEPVWVVATAPPNSYRQIAPARGLLAPGGLGNSSSSSSSSSFTHGNRCRRTCVSFLFHLILLIILMYLTAPSNRCLPAHAGSFLYMRRACLGRPSWHRLFCP